MKIIADLHLHSYYSRATSKNLNLEHLAKWAQIKGIDIVGTGDFVHPGWLKELQEKLEPAEEGLFKLKDEFLQTTQPEVPAACAAPVRFMLTVEISNIYKRLDKVRKIHNILFAPHFEAALTIQAKLDAIGNIHSDGRPILGLDSRDLLEITLEADDHAFLVPAHIWTPWFSALGSKGGFDRMSDCFGDLTEHIFAVETGLSSDPLMNWRLSQLDPYILISNSDAHSPQKLGREATVFETDLSYYAIYDAMKNPQNKGLVSTIEFFPEEGKYHFDGHRKCDMRMHPRETEKHKGLCPQCGKPVVVGVMSRVEELADREEGIKSPRSRPYFSLIPLPEIIAEAEQKGPATKTVQEIFNRMVHKIGNEMFILQEAPLEDIAKAGGPVVCEAIRRMRSGDVNIAAGYDGEFGVIKIFSDDERQDISRQSTFITGQDGIKPTKKKEESRISFDSGEINESEPEQKAEEIRPVRNYLYHFNQKLYEQRTHSMDFIRDAEGESRPLHTPVVNDLQLGAQLPEDVNAAQWRAVTHMGGHLLIIAGPGTGKTHTLTYRIAHVAQCFAAEEDILALTFTNRAADEMKDRLRHRMPEEVDSMTIGTFHSFCLHFLRQHAAEAGLPENFSVATSEEIQALCKRGWTELNTSKRQKRIEEISLWKAQGITDKSLISSPKTSRRGQRTQNSGKHEHSSRREAFALSLDDGNPIEVQEYNSFLRAKNLLDFDDLLLETLRLLRANSTLLEMTQASFRFIFVDEYQDINPVQHALLKQLVQNGVLLTAIGDPNQAIYGFRGADVSYFNSFPQDFPNARVLELSENYRSAANILSASCQVMDKAKRVQVPPLTAKIYTQGRLIIHESPTEKAEAEYVVHQIEKMVGGTSMFSHDSGRAASEMEAERSFGDIAVLYRLHTQKNALEEAFERSGIPYQVAGEKPLIACTGVAEILTMLRLANHESVSLEAAGNVLQFVVKGIGEQGIRLLEELCSGNTILIGREELKTFADAAKARGKMKEFLQELNQLEQKMQENGLIAAIQHILVLQSWQDKFTGNKELTRNWERLLRIARNRKIMGDFLDYLMLQRNEDAVEAQSERVSLLTLHAAKGLEFPVVFITGCENKLLPLNLNDMQGDSDEERRLFYVGMTRAKNQLYLLRAKKRLIFGKTLELAPSPYLADIEEQLKAYEQATQMPKRRKKRGYNENQLSLF
ncbi:UvrD-helicase domain-containing protein [candidate division KSB1 bacterium]|nr:UvrD-helicase domain-containing protein [candidate division KSB1 bacterium]